MPVHVLRLGLSLPGRGVLRNILKSGMSEAVRCDEREERLTITLYIYPSFTFAGLAHGLFVVVG